MVAVRRIVFVLLGGVFGSGVLLPGSASGPRVSVAAGYRKSIVPELWLGPLVGSCCELCLVSFSIFERICFGFVPQSAF